MYIKFMCIIKFSQNACINISLRSFFVSLQVLNNIYKVTYVLFVLQFSSFKISWVKTVYKLEYLLRLCSFIPHDAALLFFLKKTQYVVFAFLNPYINKGTQTLRTPICF